MFSAPDLLRPAIMGIVNVTPDSFSDGTLNPHVAAAHARTLVAQGADLLDLGAEASSFFRPGITGTAPEEQLRRLLPVLAQLTNLSPRILFSIDTRSAVVTRDILTRIGDQTLAIKNPVVINDISAGTHDPELLATVAAHDAGVILMHITPTYPATPAADDPEIMLTVASYLLARAQAALAAGIPHNRIALDPGLGFGKTMADNWRLALRAAQLALYLAPYPLVLGASRKRFLETPPPLDTPLPQDWPARMAELARGLGQAADVHPRDAASAALVQLVPSAIHRLHNLTLCRAL